MNSTFQKEHWTTKNYQEFLSFLISQGNPSLQEFNNKIIPTLQPILGIKTEELRKIAKEIAKGNRESFFEQVTHFYYEETLIYGMVLGSIQTESIFDQYFPIYLSHVDNWATCDLCVSSFKIMKKKDYFPLAKKLLKEKEEMTQRVGVVVLLDHYLMKENLKKSVQLVAKIHSSYYYVNMAIAWLLSTAYLKDKQLVTKLLKEKSLPPFVHNKTISKICDSYRVSKEEKAMLKHFRIPSKSYREEHK